MKNVWRAWLSVLMCYSIAPVWAIDVAIPPMNNAPSALNYHNIPIDNVPESKEPLVDAANLGIATRSYYVQANGLNPPYFRKFNSALSRVFVRQGIAKKLLQANRILKPHGVEVLLFDGYRPIELQRELWDYFVNQAKQVLKSPTDEQCVDFAGRFCSDPRKFKKDDWHTWPTHTTGGAVDVTLREIGSGNDLYMGGIFDDASEVSYSDYYERNTGPDNSVSFAEAKRNRRLLYNAMTTAGFVNYPYEWWHFDYGTQMWVMNAHKNMHAIYGRAELPPRK